MIDIAEVAAQMERVPAFRGCCFFLSNYYPVPLRFAGEDFWGVEQLWHWMKCSNDRDRSRIMATDNRSLGTAAKSVSVRPDWAEKKDAYCLEMERLKFHQGGAALARMLADTAPVPLVERNNWGCRHWGVDENGRGENVLGRTLMKVRSEVAAELADGTWNEGYEPRMHPWDGTWRGD